MDIQLSGSTTEEINPDSLHIDECSTEEMLRIINRQDALVIDAVNREIPSIAAAVNIAYDALKNGGRMIYLGAGTSGRLGVLDASECPPTYGTDPQLVQGHIAGGDTALRSSIEDCEDDEEAGRQLIRDCNVTSRDVVVGITASGRTPYVLGAVSEARAIGAATIGIANNRDSRLSELCDVCISPIVGPEVITGSTRMKAGTSQKLVLNMLSTCTMVKLGKVYGNLMVDLRASNSKLRDRAARIICTVTGVSKTIAFDYLEKSDMNTKLSIMMIKTGLDAHAAQTALDKHSGRLAEAIREFGL